MSTLDPARKEMEEELRRSELKYQSLFDNSPVSLMYLDISELLEYIESVRRTGVHDFREYIDEHPEFIPKILSLIKVVNVNKATLEFYSARGMDGFSGNVADYVGEESWGIIKESIVTLLEGETSLEFDIHARTPKGGVLPIHVKGTLVSGQEKTLNKLYVSLLDISDRIGYETKLKALHRHSVQLFKAVNTDEIFKITFEAMTDILGFAIRDLIVVRDGMLIDVLLSETERDFSSSPLSGPGVISRAARTRTSQLVRDVRTHDDYVMGRVDTLSELAVPVVFDDETVIVLNVESSKVGAFNEQDRELLEILAIHAASAVQRHSQVEHLEEMVEAKSNELVAAERMVAAGRVASMVGHDLRGPLQVINNALFLFDTESDRNKELLSLIKESVDRANEMIDEFRNQVRDSPLMLLTGDLEAFVNSVVAEHVFPDAVEVKITSKGSLDSISYDPLKIRRVLDNLFRNAVEAMPEGGRLEVSLLRDGDDAVIEVSDTGIGIPESELPLLFRPFHTTKGDGLGLGLAFCKRAVEAHGGSIYVESMVGEGTRFTIRFPAEKLD